MINDLIQINCVNNEVV